MDLGAQWQYIEQVAAERLQNNITRRHVSQYGTYIEVIGAAGELAARRFLGLPETLHTHLDDRCDMFYKGMSIDTQATVWTNAPAAVLVFALAHRKAHQILCGHDDWCE